MKIRTFELHRHGAIVAQGTELEDKSVLISWIMPGRGNWSMGLSGVDEVMRMYGTSGVSLSWHDER